MLGSETNLVSETENSICASLSASYEAESFLHDPLWIYLNIQYILGLNLSLLLLMALKFPDSSTGFGHPHCSRYSHSDKPSLELRLIPMDVFLSKVKNLLLFQDDSWGENILFGSVLAGYWPRCLLGMQPWPWESLSVWSLSNNQLYS